MGRNTRNASELMNTVLAAQGQGIDLGEGTKATIQKLLQKQLGDLQLAEENEKKVSLQRAEQAKRIEHQKKFLRENCRHQKENGRTALQGQRLQNGQLALVCCRCGTNFHTPAIKAENQYEPPPRLIPSQHVGGATGATINSI